MLVRTYQTITDHYSDNFDDKVEKFFRKHAAESPQRIDQGAFQTGNTPNTQALFWMMVQYWPEVSDEITGTHRV